MRPGFVRPWRERSSGQRGRRLREWLRARNSSTEKIINTSEVHMQTTTTRIARTSSQRVGSDHCDSQEAYGIFQHLHFEVVTVAGDKTSTATAATARRTKSTDGLSGEWAQDANGPLWRDAVPGYVYRRTRTGNWLLVSVERPELGEFGTKFGVPPSPQPQPCQLVTSSDGGQAWRLSHPNLGQCHPKTTIRRVALCDKIRKAISTSVRPG